jgi:hypothetical protein
LVFLFNLAAALRCIKEEQLYRIIFITSTRKINIRVRFKTIWV